MEAVRFSLRRPTGIYGMGTVTLYSHRINLSTWREAEEKRKRVRWTEYAHIHTHAQTHTVLSFAWL